MFLEYRLKINKVVLGDIYRRRKQNFVKVVARPVCGIAAFIKGWEPRLIPAANENDTSS